MELEMAEIEDTQSKLIKWHDFFWENGYLVVKNVLSPLEIESYLQKAKSIPQQKGYHQNTRVRIFEYDYSFVQLLEKEPIISLMKMMLGENLHIITQMVHVMEKGTEVLRWHIDENYVPVPEKFRLEQVCSPIINGIHCHYYLVDVPIAMGPTQVVPKSHTSGRAPTNADGIPPVWQNNEAISLEVKAGDCVMYSNQLWHSGSPNTAGQKRYAIVNFYGRRFVAQRLYPFVNYKIPDEIFSQCTESQKQLLGAHPVGKIYG